MDKPQTPRCAICGTPEQLLRCAKCKTVYYCSTGHQHMDWPAHRQDCRLLARQKNNNKAQQIQQLQQLQQAVAATSLEVEGAGSGAGATANCSTAQMMTPAAQAQSWPAEVDNLLNYFGSAATQMDIGLASTPTSSDNSNYGSNGYVASNDDDDSYNFVVPQAKLLPPPPAYHNVLPQVSSNINRSHHIGHNEKSSSFQIGMADANFMGTGSDRRYEDLCRNIINDMNQYGLSVVDDFLGMEKGLKILNEVRSMYNAGAFHDGQLVHNMKTDAHPSAVRGDKIRGDKIKWVGGTEPGCSNVCYLTNQIDSVIYRVNTMMNNGILGNYHIRERTRAMVACYPGSGTHYVMHVDNPNKDGRVITAIYYLNINWDARESGGILRIRPTPGTTVADIEPKFDRLLFFWSDIRNPHEVQPAHRTRYAITVWYFDAKEREEALMRAKQENSQTNNANAGHAQQAEPDSTTSAAASSKAAATKTAISSTTATSANEAFTPASMSTGSGTGALNANVPSTSCAAGSEICT